MYRKGGPAGIPLFSGRGNWGDCPHPMPLKQKFMPSVPALKQKSSCPLTLPWNKSSAFWPCPETKKVHALWPCPETKVHAFWPCPETKVHALWPCPETKKFMPSDPALKQKFMPLWPYPSFYIIDIISSFLTIIIPLKAGCRWGSLNPWIGDSGSPAASKWEREAELALALPACLPNSASRTLLF